MQALELFKSCKKHSTPWKCTGTLMSRNNDPELDINCGKKSRRGTIC